MRRFLFFIPAALACAVINPGPGSTQVQNLPATDEQPFNRVYTIETDERGAPHLSSIKDLAPQDVGFDTILQGRPTEQPLPEKPEKIHPLLREWLVQKTPSTNVEVIITFREDVNIPHLPRLLHNQPLTSQANQRIITERARLIERLRQQRKASQARLVQYLQRSGLVVLDQFWLINGLFAQVPIGGVELVALDPAVLYIRPRFGGEQPPDDGDPNNDVGVARMQIQSDSYFDNAIPFSNIAVVDTGVRYTHTLFRNPRHLGVLRDCVHGDSDCKQTNPPNADYNPTDDCDHGTSTIAIIAGNANLGNSWRGVTDDIVDSFKVYAPSPSCGLDAVGAIHAFQAALVRGDDVIVAEIQATEPDTGPFATAADHAYDAGAIVIAANGNHGPDSGTVNSPAIAHKVIGVGAYDVESGATPSYQSRGPAPDGRIKPDIQGPTDTETASSLSDTELHVFTGTSGSTPYVAAATALVHDWLLTSFGVFDNGQTYAWAIASGQTFFPSFNNTVGVGKVKLLVGGTATIGKVSVSNGQTIDVSEPLFLEQYQQAGESIEVIGHWCLCMVYASCKAYLEEYIREMERDYRGLGDLRTKLAGKKAKSWFERYRLLFLEEVGIDWRKGPVDLAQLEHLNLTRDDVTHNVDVMSILVFQTDRHKEQHPKGLFIDDWACWGLGGRIKVGREELTAALRTVDGFCAWHEGIRLHYPSYIKSLAESQSSEVS